MKNKKLITSHNNLASLKLKYPSGRNKNIVAGGYLKPTFTISIIKPFVGIIGRFNCERIKE
ncbi:MAG: hypothetical protein ABI550_05220 [Ignavibacteriaceae bacterium]